MKRIKYTQSDLEQIAAFKRIVRAYLKINRLTKQTYDNTKKAQH